MNLKIESMTFIIFYFHFEKKIEFDFLFENNQIMIIIVFCLLPVIIYPNFVKFRVQDLPFCDNFNFLIGYVKIRYKSMNLWNNFISI